MMKKVALISGGHINDAVQRPEPWCSITLHLDARCTSDENMHVISYTTREPLVLIAIGGRYFIYADNQNRRFRIVPCR
jgi:hypothetical protein